MKEMWSFTKEFVPGNSYRDWRDEDRVRDWRRYNDWYLDFDDVFARTFLSSLPFRSLPSTAQPCSCCSAILAEVSTVVTYTISVSGMRTSAENCSICKLLLQAFQRAGQDGDENIDIERGLLTLSVGAGGQRVLRFCAEPEYAVRVNSKFPIGRPFISEPNNPARFALLRAWLRRCDGSHVCNEHQIESESAMPTRVLYVGDRKDSGYDSDFVRLVRASETTKQKYIALSYCWGNISISEKEQFCTTEANISERLGGFRLSVLPKTLQDAVKVTRELGVLYLWIDLLCIIQYGDGSEDWKRESGRMESVFSYAYCTLAATAAVDSYAGFLERDIRPEYVHIQDALGKAQLNTRAWVIQERVLARRTIYFSAN